MPRDLRDVLEFCAVDESTAELSRASSCRFLASLTGVPMASVAGGAYAPIVTAGVGVTDIPLAPGLNPAFRMHQALVDYLTARTDVGHPFLELGSGLGTSGAPLETELVVHAPDEASSLTAVLAALVYELGTVQAGDNNNVLKIGPNAGRGGRRDTTKPGIWLAFETRYKPLFPAPGPTWTEWHIEWYADDGTNRRVLSGIIDQATHVPSTGVAGLWRWENDDRSALLGQFTSGQLQLTQFLYRTVPAGPMVVVERNVGGPGNMSVLASDALDTVTLSAGAAARVVTDRAFGLAVYTVAQANALSAEQKREGNLVMVSNESGGNQPAFADGAGNWRRFTDRAVIT